MIVFILQGERCVSFDRYSRATFHINYILLTALSSFIGYFHFDFNLINLFFFCGFGLLHLSLLTFDLCAWRTLGEFVY